ncbi:MAG: cation diffusion facilitator family transporter [Thermoplasmatota archaeon]
MIKQKLSRPEYLAGLTAVVLILLGVIQILFGELWAKSVALTANGFDCIGDGFVSATVWAGLKIYKRPADDRFHFGYYKIENLASIAAAIVMMVLAGYIVFRSYNQLIDPHPVKLPLIGIALALFAAIVALGLGWYKHQKGKNEGLGSVNLDAFNTVKDGVASGLTVVALIAASFGFIIADAIAGFIIAGIIVSIGLVAIKESSYMLMDACDNDCILQEDLIRRMIRNIDEIEDAHLVRLRRAGPVIQGELEIIVPGDMTITRFYEIRKQIIAEAEEKIPTLDRLSVIVHPHHIKEKN